MKLIYHCSMGILFGLAWDTVGINAKFWQFLVLLAFFVINGVAAGELERRDFWR
jgi:hypothetical protein